MSEDPDTALLPPRVIALIAAEHDGWTRALVGLDLAVMAKIEALEAPPALSPEVLRILADEALPGADPDLAFMIMARIETEVALELDGDVLPGMAEMRAEIAHESERMQTERVVSQVSAEIRSIGPRIEREMPRAVAARIEAEKAPVIPLRKKLWMSRTLKGAMAAAAALMIYMQVPGSDSGLPSGLSTVDPAGEAQVDEVSYDNGTVTVTESDDGVPVIWLADDDSST